MKVLSRTQWWCGKEGVAHMVAQLPGERMERKGTFCVEWWCDGEVH